MQEKNRFSRIVVIAICVIFLFIGKTWAWRFAVMADSRGMPPSSISSVLSKIVDRVITDKPAFVLFAGDMILGSSTAEPLKYQLVSWQKAISPFIRTGIAVYPAIGNHEVYGKRKYSSRQERICKDILKLPTNGPIGYKGLVYSFDYANVRFIVLDSDLAGDEFEKIVDGQLLWLEKQLMTSGRKHIFVIFHEPAFPVGPHKNSSLDIHRKDRDKLWNLFVKYNVRAVFVGHEHLYNRSIHKGIWQIISGTCGAPIYHGYGGAFYHYVVVDVDGDDVVMTTKDINGRIRDTIPLTRETIENQKPIFTFVQITGNHQKNVANEIASLKRKPAFILASADIKNNYKTYKIDEQNYSFIYESTVFIIFNTRDINRKQVSWFENELRKHKKAERICVFTIKPLIAYGRKQNASTQKNGKNRKEILKLMKRYNVAFCASMNSLKDYFAIGDYVNHIGISDTTGMRIYYVYPKYIISKFKPVNKSIDDDKTYYCPKLEK